MFHLWGVHRLGGEDLFVEYDQVLDKGAVVVPVLFVVISEKRAHQILARDELEPGKGKSRVLNGLHDMECLDNGEQHASDVCLEAVVRPVEVVEDVEHELEEDFVVEVVGVVVVFFGHDYDDCCEDVLEEVYLELWVARNRLHEDCDHLADLVDVGIIELDHLAGSEVEPF